MIGDINWLRASLTLIIIRLLLVYTNFTSMSLTTTTFDVSINLLQLFDEKEEIIINYNALSTN